MPSFLLKVARDQDYDYEAALTRFYDESVFSAYELDRLDITGLLWQTGYLTIKEVRREDEGLQYRLDFPDKEVQATFTEKVIEFLVGVKQGDEASSLARQLRTAIRKDDLTGFMTLFQSFLACISYDMHIPNEKILPDHLLRCLQAVGRERRGGIPHERRANRRVHPHTEKRLYF